MRTIVDVAVPPKSQVTLSPEDRAVLDSIMAAVPWITGSEAAPFIRMLMRLGLQMFVENPGAAKRVTDPGPPPLASLMAKLQSAMAKDPSMGGTSFNFPPPAGPPSISPASGTPVAGGMTTKTFVASGGPSSPPTPAPAEPKPEVPRPDPPKPKKKADPSKGKGRRDDPAREPTQEELDEYNRKARR